MVRTPAGETGGTGLIPEPSTFFRNGTHRKREAGSPASLERWMNPLPIPDLPAVAGPLDVHFFAAGRFQFRIFDVPTPAVGVIVGFVAETEVFRFRGNGHLHPLPPVAVADEGFRQGLPAGSVGGGFHGSGIFSGSRFGLHPVPGVEGE